MCVPPSRPQLSLRVPSPVEWAQLLSRLDGRRASGSPVITAARITIGFVTLPPRRMSQSNTKRMPHFYRKTMSNIDWDMHAAENRRRKTGGKKGEGARDSLMTDDASSSQHENKWAPDIYSPPAGAYIHVVVKNFAQSVRNHCTTATISHPAQQCTQDGSFTKCKESGTCCANVSLSWQCLRQEHLHFFFFFFTISLADGW